MPLTEAWFKLRYHAKQAALWRTKARFCGVAAGRGSGKTECARRRVVRMLSLRRPWSDPLFFYALPTYGQAKRVAWPALLKLVPQDWLAATPNTSELSIKTIYGSTLFVVGMDKPQRIEGSQYDGCVVDESSDQRPHIFERSIRPALTHREGWCWRIGVPKRFGLGGRDFHSFCLRGQRNEDGIEHYTWSSADIVDPKELEQARKTMDERDYAEQYEASWQSTSGAVFHAFDTELNVKEVKYDASARLIIGSDFNVDPMCWVIGHNVNGQLHVFDELFIRNTNTAATLDRLYRVYGSHTAGFDFYGDATSKQRKTSAAASDYAQIRNDKRFKGARVLYRTTNPRVIDRFASCNALLCNAEGTRRLLVNPKCKHLIEDLSSRAYKEGLREADDYGDIGHITDALGYIVHWLFPSTLLVRTTTPQFEF